MPRIQSGEDLRGKTLATFDEHSTFHQVLVNFLGRYGLIKDKDYLIKVVKPHQEYQYLNDGAIIFTHEPWASIGGSGKFLSFYEYVDNRFAQEAKGRLRV
jgi:ABC-type nitrate/sulfonate/bicarbonate transport system substrate-binding protein